MATMTQAQGTPRITAGERAGIPPRRMDFEFPDETTKYWYGDSAFLTTFWVTLSALFPEGETFFVDSVKNYRKDIKDQKQKIEEYLKICRNQVDLPDSGVSMSGAQADSGLAALTVGLLC